MDTEVEMDMDRDESAQSNEAAELIQLAGGVDINQCLLKLYRNQLTWVLQLRTSLNILFSAPGDRTCKFGQFEDFTALIQILIPERNPSKNMGEDLSALHLEAPVEPSLIPSFASFVLKCMSRHQSTSPHRPFITAASACIGQRCNFSPGLAMKQANNLFAMCSELWEGGGHGVPIGDQYLSVFFAKSEHATLYEQAREWLSTYTSTADLKSGGSTRGRTGSRKRKRTEVPHDPPDAVDMAEVDDTGNGGSDEDSADSTRSYDSEDDSSGYDAADMVSAAESVEDVRDTSSSEDSCNGSSVEENDGDSAKDSGSVDSGSVGADTLTDAECVDGGRGAGEDESMLVDLLSQLLYHPKANPTRIGNLVESKLDEDESFARIKALGMLREKDLLGAVRMMKQSRTKEFADVFALALKIAEDEVREAPPSTGTPPVLVSGRGPTIPSGGLHDFVPFYSDGMPLDLELLKKQPTYENTTKESVILTIQNPFAQTLDSLQATAREYRTLKLFSAESGTLTITKFPVRCSTRVDIPLGNGSSMSFFQLPIDGDGLCGLRAGCWNIVQQINESCWTREKLTHMGCSPYLGRVFESAVAGPEEITFERFFITRFLVEFRIFVGNAQPTNVGRNSGPDKISEGEFRRACQNDKLSSVYGKSAGDWLLRYLEMFCRMAINVMILSSVGRDLVSQKVVIFDGYPHQHEESFFNPLLLINYSQVFYNGALLADHFDIADSLIFTQDPLTHREEKLQRLVTNWGRHQLAASRCHEGSPASQVTTQTFTDIGESRSEASYSVWVSDSPYVPSPASPATIVALSPSPVTPTVQNSKKRVIHQRGGTGAVRIPQRCFLKRLEGQRVANDTWTGRQVTAILCLPQMEVILKIETKSNTLTFGGNERPYSANERVTVAEWLKVLCNACNPDMEPGERVWSCSLGGQPGTLKDQDHSYISLPMLRAETARDPAGIIVLLMSANVSARQGWLDPAIGQEELLTRLRFVLPADAPVNEEMGVDATYSVRAKGDMVIPDETLTRWSDYLFRGEGLLSWARPPPLGRPPTVEIELPEESKLSHATVRSAQKVSGIHYDLARVIYFGPEKSMTEQVSHSKSTSYLPSLQYPDSREKRDKMEAQHKDSPLYKQLMETALLDHTVLLRETNIAIEEDEWSLRLSVGRSATVFFAIVRRLDANFRRFFDPAAPQWSVPVECANNVHLLECEAARKWAGIAPSNKTHKLKVVLRALRNIIHAPHTESQEVGVGCEGDAGSSGITMDVARAIRIAAIEMVLLFVQISRTLQSTVALKTESPGFLTKKAREELSATVCSERSVIDEDLENECALWRSCTCIRHSKYLENALGHAQMLEAHFNLGRTTFNIPPFIKLRFIAFTIPAINVKGMMQSQGEAITQYSYANLPALYKLSVKYYEQFAKPMGDRKSSVLSSRFEKAFLESTTTSAIYVSTYDKVYDGDTISVYAPQKLIYHDTRSSLTQEDLNTSMKLRFEGFDAHEMGCVDEHRSNKAKADRKRLTGLLRGTSLIVVLTRTMWNCGASLSRMRAHIFPIGSNEVFSNEDWIMRNMATTLSEWPDFIWQYSIAVSMISAPGSSVRLHDEFLPLNLHHAHFLLSRQPVDDPDDGAHVILGLNQDGKQGTRDKFEGHYSSDDDNEVLSQPRVTLPDWSNE